MQTLNRLCLLCVFLFLSACGGGSEPPRQGPPQNEPVVADAGGPYAPVTEGDEVLLQGSATGPQGETLSFQWTQTDGPAVALSGADTATARFTAPEVERAEQLVFTLTVTASGGGQDTDTARVQVLNTPPSLSIADASAAEAEGMMRFPVSLSRASEEIVSVAFATADGSAVAGSDYVASSGTLEIPAGETLAQIEVPLLDDGTQVPEARFTVTLSEPDNARLERAVATGTILNSTVFACPAGQFCAGAAKRSVAPSDRHIEGVIEERLSADAEGRVGEKRQQFNLGGYGDVGRAPDSTDVDIGGPAATGNYAVAEEDGEAHSTYVRALVLELDGQTLALVTLDAIGAGNLIQAGMKRAISAASGIDEDNILIGQSHSHSAADLQGLWGGVPDTWLDCDADRFGLDGCGEADAWTQGLYQLAAAAVQEAFDRRAPAELLSATGQAQRNNFRRPKIRAEEQTDQALTVLQARRADGTVIGTLMQYAAHPTVLGLSNRQVHTDFVLSGLVRLEQAQGGVALYFNGPIADASPRTPPDSEMPAALRCSGLTGVENGYCRARNLGIRIADDALQILQSAAQPISPALTVRHATAVLPVTNPLFIAAGAARSFNRYYNFVETPADQIPQVQALRAELPQLTPTASTQVSRITLGAPQDGAGLEIVTIPGEATNSFGQMIRRQAYGAEGAASRPMMLLGLTHNSFGYIIPEEEFGGPVNGEAPYEETVSLGPLTAPLLRLQAYYPLFDTPQEEQIPEYLSACRASPDDPACVLQVLEDRVLTGALACLDPGSPQCPAQELLELFGDGLDELEKGCRDREFPSELCDTIAQVGDALEGGGDGRPAGDEALVAAAFDAQLRGCDILDTASCLFPFPSDHYTVPAAAGSPQSVERGGTGRRIRFLPQAMPRNILGKPVDPSEWNRNDGFSPGQMILTYVPGLGVERDAANQPFGPVRGAVPLTDLSRVDDPDAAVVVLEVPDNAVELPRRHLVWAEIDLNAGLLLPSEGQANPAQAARPALIVRPAQNFREGRRYVVALRNLRDDNGNPLAAQPAFATCRDGRVSLLPPVVSRCQALEQNVFGVLDRAGIARDDSLYLAWDFTTASAENNIARLRHMRDDAFAALGQVETPAGEITDLGRAPAYTVTAVQENPSSLIARRVTGTFTVPSYLVPADASPLNESEQFQAFLAQLAANQPQQLEMLRSECRRFAPVGEACDVFTPGRAAALGSTVSAPPNRLYYQPDAASAGACAGLSPEQAATSGCAAQAAYGDGLPDRPGGNATLTVNFTCNIPRAALDSPARPSLYGHGLLGGQGEVNNGEHVATLAQEGNMMLCATDWYGFASGDVPNVASVLVDLSNFPVIPDASQQGVLNFLYLARLLRHPGGFAADPAFQFEGRPAHDTREVFYDGNSQGGILGGVVVAASKDVQRGVLGVPGMNYSTLLTRSVDFDIYSIPLYLAYPDDLDRNIVFSLMQMLWDRSENNGYAHHITDNRAFKGPDNEVLLHVGFADHQVTMWSADVMARTIGAPVDRSRVVGADRHPDHDEYFRLPALDYQDPVQAQGSALLVWDEPWSSGRCGNNSTPTPPVGNVPPRDGADPHECPRRERVARCQKAHFLQREGRLIDVPARDRDAPDFLCPAIEPITDAPPAGEPAAARPDYGPGLIGILAGFTGGFGEALGLLVQGEFETALNNLAAALQSLLTQLLALVAGDDNSVAVLVAHAAENLQAGDAPALVEDAGDDLGNVIGLDADPLSAVQREAAVRREVEPVVLTGAQLPLWSVPAAQGAPYPYPSGALITGELFDQLGLLPGQVQDAHNGVILYPPPGAPPELMGLATERLAAFAWDGSAFVEIPVQVDQKFPFFLANANSDFSTYSGTDEELSYEWDLERWDNSDRDACFASYLPGKRDPVSGLDHDDEIVFMAADAGTAAPATARPPGLDPAQPVQEVALFDPLQPGTPRYVYLGLKPAGARSAFAGTQHYVRYERDPNADQWIDRGFFTEDDPEKLGTSNTGYGPNRSGKVCPDGSEASKRDSTDRFPRDGVTVSTDTYRWYASGRWMIREIRIADPDTPGEFGPDLLDRWKGRAFQQSPDSTISVVGFEDEQVNWEGNSTLLGERAGPVRAIREVWGADSGTNVTKTETFYRDAVAYRYRVRVHPIPPDGLYTSWDYNRSAMVPEAGEDLPGGRYYTALRPHGVPVDGINDDLGQLDNLFPVNGQCLTPEGPRPPDITGRCPAFFDVADPTFNAPLAFDNWEQVSAKGRGGSLVYVFELKGATSLANPLVVPYYRDDACLDDGTGDDPVPRPFPGESYSWNGGKVPVAYDAMAGRALDHTGRVFADCIERQGAHASHGIHYFFTHDTDNSFVLGKPNNEVDAEQWQFMVPTRAPENLGAAYANVVRARLQAVIVPRAPQP